MLLRLRLRLAAALVPVLAAAACASVPGLPCAPGEHRAVAELMYFGTAMPGGTVSEDAWAAFLRDSATPRFPQGLTVWRAAGQWRAPGPEGIGREAAYVLSIVHGDDDASNAAVRAIAAEYKARFSQEAVLRTRSAVCAAF